MRLPKVFAWLGRKFKNRRWRKSRHRRWSVESLEPRLLLAGDSSEQFADSLQSAVGQIGRVLESVEQAPALQADISWLGTLQTENVGGQSAIDPTSIGELMDLSAQFQSQIAQPLESFLNTNPGATAQQLANALDFVDPIQATAGIEEGVAIQFDLATSVASPLSGLLEQLDGDIQLLDAVSGDALDTNLSFDITTTGLSFQVLRDTSGQLGISIPQFTFDLSHDTGLPIEFAAGVGFLAGSIEGGSIELDLQFTLDTGSLLSDPALSGQLSGFSSTDVLGEISASEIYAGLQLGMTGDGLFVDLPFDFELPGLDTGGFLPRFQAADRDPLDDDLPTFELVVPYGAPYEAADLLGFHTIDETSILSSLEQLGTVFGAWEEGSLLNLPVPLADNLTLGDAVGIADSYGSAVLQFLRNGDGFPTFSSVQELADLIPAINDVGPIESLS